jgi:hypothetical protein
MEENKIIYHDFTPKKVAEEKVEETGQITQKNKQETVSRLIGSLGVGSFLEREQILS